MLESVSGKKIRKNTEEAPYFIPGASTEPNNNLRFNPFVEIKIGFLLEVDCYSCE